MERALHFSAVAYAVRCGEVKCGLAPLFCLEERRKIQWEVPGVADVAGTPFLPHDHSFIP